MVTTQQGTSEALRGCLDACDRCERVLDTISPEMFAGTSPEGYPIGSHLRHTLDHFVCLLRTLDEGFVDYDGRDRDPELEQNPERFRALLREVRDGLRSLPAETLQQPIKVHQIAALDADRSILDSTVERELVFLSSHTIHHLALVVHLCRTQGVDLPEDIALAFSTAAYRKSTAR